MVEKHKHSCHTVIGGRRKCFCGAVLCLSVRPEPYDGANLLCNLEKGHEGPCENTNFCEVGTWEKPAEKQTVTILVEDRRRERNFCVAYLKERPEASEIGQTMDEAVGHFIRNHQEELSLKIAWK